jgi:hypothetical protein
MDATFENVKNYTSQLGIFWHSFNGLEMMLRIYLGRKSGVGTKNLIAYINANLGETLPEYPITDWKTFKMLCDEFNKDKSATDQIDFTEINALRDAMAHGRVTGDSAGNMIVVKYSRPSGNRVTVEFKRTLSDSYINKMTEFMGGATQKVSTFIAPYMKD